MSTFLTLNPGALGEKVLMEDAKLTDVQIQSVFADTALDVARGALLEFSRVEKFAANIDLGTTERDIWIYGGVGAPYGNIDYPWPTTADTLTIQSDSTSDDATPTTNPGAHSITIQGLGNDWLPLQVTEPLNGVDPVVTTAQFRRIYRGWSEDVGTYGGANIGNITIKHTTTDTVLAFIEAGIGQTQLSPYTIPAGSVGFIRKALPQVSVGTNKQADIKLWQRPNADLVVPPYASKRLIYQWLDLQSAPPNPFSAVGPFPPKTDIWASAKATGSGSRVDFSYVLTLITAAA